MSNYIKRKLLKYFPASIIRILKKLQKKKTNSCLIQNININSVLDCQKRVLISYITEPLTTDSFIWNTSTRSKECSLIIKAFVDRGYVVDLIGCNDDDKLFLIKDRAYDVIFGFGSIFYNMSITHTVANRILYLTEKPPYFSQRKEQERIDYFYKRHHSKIPLGRTGQYYQEKHFKEIDSIIYVGTEEEKSLINVNVNVPCHPVAVTGLTNKLFRISQRNVHDAKKNFLWLGSMGAIHKGLDILIDVFEEQNDCVLHIAGLNSLDRSMLQPYKNINCIRDHGFLSVQSPEFCLLMEECGFIIFPSCSEALSTAVITGMNHGLVPLITRETGFQLLGIGAYIEDFSVKSISKLIVKQASNTDEWMIDQQYQTMKFANENFNLFQYDKRINEVLKELLQ